ncbi:MAG: hypothetical protein WCX27_01220 [Candidatus Paceibacterota bacterium]
MTEPNKDEKGKDVSSPAADEEAQTMANLEELCRKVGVQANPP